MVAWGISKSSVLYIGTWSVHGGRLRGAVSQVVNASSVCVVQNTLSGLVQFPVLVDWSVGLSLGSAICRSKSAISSMMRWAVS